MAADVSVDTNPDDACCIGRNGFFRLSKVRLSIWSNSNGVDFDLVSKHGHLLNAGLSISREEMDLLAQRWLTFRGWTLSHPGVEEHEGA